MVTKFTKKELLRLRCTDEEISLVMKYQKLLPMPDEDFEMNARTLHQYLGMGRDVSTWISSRIKKYGFKEKSDYEIKFESNDPKLGTLIFLVFLLTSYPE